MPESPASAARPRVSLLLPNRDNEPVLERVLAALHRTTTYADVELVAVDDGSTDRSREILRAWGERFPRFQLHELEHGGVVRALNTGLEAATGEVVVQLDADAELQTTGWVERLLGLLLSDERVGLVTGRVVLDTGFIHACGVDIVGPEGLHDRTTTITEPIGRRTWHSRADRVRDGEGGAAEREPAEVDSGIGCCMMYRKTDALAAGGYDMGYSPVWFDDLDLCIALRRLGRKAFCLPDVRVEHLVTARHGTPPSDAGEPRDRAKRAVAQARIRAGALLPPAARRTVVQRMNLDKPPAAQAERLRHHYAYWREKWGWDLLNPDMAEVRRRYGDSEVCWASDPERVAAGREILAAFAARPVVTS